MSDKKPGAFMKLLTNVGLAEETPDPVASRTPPPGHPSVPAPYVSSSAPPMGMVDPETISKLETRLQKNCPPIYTAFMEQYENLKDVIPVDEMRFKAALKASHATTDQLCAAIDQLVGVMDTAKADFQHTFEDSRAAKVGSAEASLKATAEQIAAYEQQLKTVQDTITTLRTKHDADQQAMQAEAAKIESVHANFDAAHAQVVKRLNDQKTRVQTMPRI